MKNHFVRPLLVCAALFTAGFSIVPVLHGQTTTALDVNDVSILWPVPKTQEDVERLISMDEKLDDGSEIWPGKFFDQLKDHAESLAVEGTRIGFRDEISDRHSWKIAGIRVNPSAFGVDPDIRKEFPEVPGIRLVVQPVTVAGGAAEIHDFAAHVVFNFVKADPDGAAPFLPDRDAFGEVIADLENLKSLVGSTVSTKGDLNVHPGFVHEVEGFREAVGVFVRKHLSDARFQVVSFMGLPAAAPEPWLFFSMMRDAASGDFAGRNVKGFAEDHPVQMLDFNGGLKPAPALKATESLASAKISTALLFGSGDLRDTGEPAGRLEDNVFPDSEVEALANLKVRDIADLIANPNFRHAGNTDCASCHTETTRRNLLGLSISESVRYPVPDGISGVAPAAIPRDVWNVRNFGWGLNFFEGRIFVPTITQRAANEAAESADFINREYLKISGPSAGPSPVSIPIDNTQPETMSEPTNLEPRQSALNLVLKVKEPVKENAAAIRQVLGHLTPDGLNNVGTVHFGRFLIMDDDTKFLLFTEYDGSFNSYVNDFINETGEVFNALLQFVEHEGELIPVQANRSAFVDFVRDNDIKEEKFYSAYPKLSVAEILKISAEQEQQD